MSDDTLRALPEAAPSRCWPSRPTRSTLEASFADDLDADSLDLVELVMALEEEFDVTVDEEELEGIETVGQAVRPRHAPSSDAWHGRPPGRRHRRRRRRARAASARRLLGRAARRRRPRASAGCHDFDPDAPASTTRRRPAGPTASPSSRSAAAAEALDQAGDARRPTRSASACWIGTGIGGLATLEEQIARPRREGRPPGLAVPGPDDDGQRRRAPRSRCATASRARARPPCTACAAGTHSIGNAARLIACGRCDVVVTGGTEAAMTPDRHRRLRQHDRDVVDAACPGPFDRTATAS